MNLPKLDLEAIRAVPLAQKVALVGIILGAVGVLFYYYIIEPKNNQIVQLQGQVKKLDVQIKSLTIKVKHLDELLAASKQLEIELAKKKEKLPPQEEAVMLLKQLTDLGIRLGLDIKLWKPGKQVLDGTKMFVRMPVKVEMAGGYHTVAMFFDRVSKLPRIVNVSDLKMGAPKVKDGRAVIQSVFDLTAYAAPTEKKGAKK